MKISIRVPFSGIKYEKEMKIRISASAESFTLEEEAVCRETNKEFRIKFTKD